MGFGIPINEWLSGPLRSWADDLLSTTKLKADGYLDADLVQEKWNQHRTGGLNWHYLLWDVLMFQAWRERWLS
jgi:asparagine synthase (glutamine-hydrolysing)